ncbi:Peptidyl-prolyl cis-trans isomerase CYP40 [Bienertia sinuspersici]
MDIATGVRLHRILKGALIQGSDISGGGESDGESIYGEKFDDENFQLRHERKGMLSMVNTGPNTNGSQFFITTTQTHQFSGNHVVFGIVIKGWALFVLLSMLKLMLIITHYLTLSLRIVEKFRRGMITASSTFLKTGTLTLTGHPTLILSQMISLGRLLLQKAPKSKIIKWLFGNISKLCATWICAGTWNH